jgi:3-oxoadipate CoA-transferase beta subunit
MDKNVRIAMAQRVARDIPEGSYVNLGIGLPTLVANHLPLDKDYFLHSENGVLGRWQAAAPGEEDWDMINAGKEPITLEPGAAFFHHADSFGMMRGGHLDICVLGAFQVSATGDLANWHTGAPDAIPAVGGAMDLAIGAKRVFVMMEHLGKDGRSKLLPECTYPLTGLGCVSRIYTELATLDITADGVKVVELIGDTTPQTLQDATEVPLDFSAIAVTPRHAKSMHTEMLAALIK